RASTERDGQQYVYTSGQGSNNAFFVAIVQVEPSGQCVLLIDGSDAMQTLESAMPFEVARELYRQNFEFSMELAGGKSELEAILREDAGGHIKQFRGEAEIEALQALDIEFPDAYTLSSVDPDVRALIVQFQRFNEPPGRKNINRVEIVGDYAIARWFQSDTSSGHYVGQRDEKGNWRALGFTNDADRPLTAEMLHDRFDIPRRTARQLMEVSGF
ncbi:MAG: hypothetical protein AAFY15_04185, partial [Cyanobacteria bacterium J06648_11]